MAALRRQKSWVVWLMTVGVIANVVAAATCCWTAGDHGPSELRDILGPMIICTAAGAKAAAPDDGSGTPAPHKHCTMCVLVAAVALALLTFHLLGVLRPQGPGLRLDWRGDLPARNHFAHCGFLSRGPPLTA